MDFKVKFSDSFMPRCIRCVYVPTCLHTLTSGCLHDPPVKLSSQPLSCIFFHVGFGMFLTFLHPVYLSSLLCVSSSCSDYICVCTLCSWGRCGWWSHAGRWHAPTCSALMPHFTSKWTRRNPPGCVLSVTRRPPMNTSSSMGKSPNPHHPIIRMSCLTC